MGEPEQMIIRNQFEKEQNLKGILIVLIALYVAFQIIIQLIYRFYPKEDVLFFITLYPVFFKDAIIIAIITNNDITNYNNSMDKIVSKTMIIADIKSYMSHIFHDIRIPINTISMGIELFKRNKILFETFNLMETLEMMEDAVIFMTTTLNNFLMVKKIETNTFELVNSIFDIRHTIARIKKTLRGQLVNKGVELIIVDNLQNSSLVNADEYKFEHILINLLNNSIKFTRENTAITIYMSFEPIYKKSVFQSIRIIGGAGGGSNNTSFNSNVSNHNTANNYKFQIKDNGPGISSDDIKTIFNEFTQIKGEHMNSGFGIGLSIVNKYVNVFQGKIYCESVLGEGANFIIILPFAIAKQQSKLSFSPEQNSSPKSNSATPPIANHHKSIRFSHNNRKIGIGQGNGQGNGQGIYQKTIQSATPESIYIRSFSERVSTKRRDNILLSKLPVSPIMELNEMSSSGNASPFNTLECIILPNHSKTNNTGRFVCSDEQSVKTFAKSLIQPSDPLEISPIISIDDNDNVNKWNDTMTKILEKEKEEMQTLLKYNVMIIDDTMSNCRILKQLFNRYNLNSVYFLCGLNAIDECRNKPDYYDIIFIDYMMPKINGPDTSRTMRANGFNKLIVGITGITEKEEIDAFYSSGADMVFPKPFDINNIYKIIEKYKEKCKNNIQNGI
jgi:signal transduction histidine kinase/ActR/RegA family two-component response regulator